MSRPKRKTQFEVSTLEGKVLLSTLACSHAPVAPAEVHTAVKAFSLNGSVSGSYSLSLTAVQLNGKGNLAGTGKVTLSGSLSVEGGVITGGSLTMTARKGTVTVGIQGGVSLPQARKSTISLKFMITGGTGAYSSASGTGSIRVGLSAITDARGTFNGNVKSNR